MSGVTYSRVSHVMCHMSIVMCHVSCDMRHVTCVICNIFFFTKGLRCLAEALLSTRPTPSSFILFIINRPSVAGAFQ